MRVHQTAMLHSKRVRRSVHTMCGSKKYEDLSVLTLSRSFPGGDAAAAAASSATISHKPIRRTVSVDSGLNTKGARRPQPVHDEPKLLSRDAMYGNVYRERLLKIPTLELRRWRARRQLEGISVSRVSEFRAYWRRTDRDTGNTMLHYLVKTDQLAVLHACLVLPRSVIYLAPRIDECNCRGESALTWAVRYDRFDAAVLLLEYGADPCIRQEVVQRTPLHEAAEFGTYAMVRLLMRYGADVDEVYHDAEYGHALNSVHLACQRLREEIHRHPANIEALDEAEMIYDAMLQSRQSPSVYVGASPEKPARRRRRSQARINTVVRLINKYTPAAQVKH